MLKLNDYKTHRRSLNLDALRCSNCLVCYVCVNNRFVSLALRHTAQLFWCDPGLGIVSEQLMAKEECV